MIVPSDWAVICSAKPIRSYLLADFIKRYKNKLILYYIIMFSSLPLLVYERTITKMLSLHTVFLLSERVEKPGLSGQHKSKAKRLKSDLGGEE